MRSAVLQIHFTKPLLFDENLNLKCSSQTPMETGVVSWIPPFKMRKIRQVSGFPAMALPCVFLRTAQPPGWLARPRFLLATRHIPPFSSAEDSSKLCPQKQMNCRHRLFLAIPRPACSTNKGGKANEEGRKTRNRRILDVPPPVRRQFSRCSTPIPQPCSFCQPIRSGQRAGPEFLI